MEELRPSVGSKRVLTKPCPGPDAKTSRPCDCGRPHVTEFIFGGSRYSKTEYECDQCHDTGVRLPHLTGLPVPCFRCSDINKAINKKLKDKQLEVIREEIK